MRRKIVFFIVIFLFIIGCSNKKMVSYTRNDNKFVSINYPVTNVSILDEAISTYVNRIYFKFNENKSVKKPELNISYTYKEVNEDVINVSIQSEIITDKTVNKIKTFTYNKKTNKFLTMEDLIDDVNVLDYDVKNLLLKKYENMNMDYLSKVSYDYFTIGDDNLTIYFNQSEIKNYSDEMIYLDIPLNSLKLLIDIDRTKDTDTYLSIKKKDISIDDKVVALTFDDGPSQYTDKILQILKKHNAYSTFFVVGNKVSFYDDTLREILKQGSEIGNHSYSHKLLTRLSEEEFKEDLNKTQEVIKKITGFTPKVFRPTYGGYTSKIKKYTDLSFVLWDVDSRDWEVKKKNKILKNVLPNVKSGSIVLMHDNHEYSLKALDTMIKELKADGYKFVTVSELLEFKNLKEE